MDNDTRARLSTEYNDLRSKIKKLETFILSNDAYDDLEEQERKDLREQLKHMTAYFEVLLRRMGRAANNA